MTQPRAEEVLSELHKVLESATFSKTERLRLFLEFIVRHALSSPDRPLKEITIGIELYAAHTEFDPRISAVVRVDATRLRAKLREYYASEGAADELIIEVPRGSYLPVFSPRTASQRKPPVTAVETAIAVLPFSNLSPQPDEYFSDGLTEAIIHALASVEGLRVVARTSAFAFKHKNSDVREIGRTLNVGLILEGSVRKSGEKLRVNAQCVSTANGYQLWSRRYDRDIHDLFAVQDEIAREIGNLLCVKAPGRQQAPAAGTDDFEAYNWYLRGRYHLNRQTAESFRRAIDCFDNALAHRPEYAAAASGKGVAWLYLGLMGMQAPLEAMPKARETAARALGVSEREGEAMSVAACTRAMYDWDWHGAEALFRKSLAAQPANDFSMHMYAMFALLPLARIEEALRMLDEARRIDPLSLFVSASRAAALLMARRNSEAEAEYRSALELDPDFWRAAVGLGRCLEARGRYDEAIACFEHAKNISEGVASAVGSLGRAYALIGQTSEAWRLMEELDGRAQHRYVSAYGRALIFLGLEDDRVFDWLERACNERAGWLMYLATDPRFDQLRGDPRFQSILQRLHLPMLAYPGCEPAKPV
jgi:TolB-like protein/Flp pilus assembly protein TadD